MSGIKTFTQSDLRVAPIEPTHLVRLQDMMEYVAGLTKDPVRVVLTDPFVGTYSTATMAITQTTPEDLVIDGVTLALGDRILLAGQTDQTQNGIYVVTTLGETTTTAAVLTRAEDFNSSAEIINGLIVPVLEGDVNADTRWRLTVGSIPYILDTSNLIFTKEVTDFTKVVEMIFAIVGDASTTMYNFTHNLDTTHVTHELYENATGETVVGQFSRTNSNAVRVTFGIPLGVGTNLTLVIRAQVDPVMYRA